METLRNFYPPISSSILEKIDISIEWFSLKEFEIFLNVLKLNVKAFLSSKLIENLESINLVYFSLGEDSDEESKEPHPIREFDLSDFFSDIPQIKIGEKYECDRKTFRILFPKGQKLDDA